MSIKKISILAALTLTFIFACKEKNHEHDHDHHHMANDSSDVSPNTLLDKEIMRIHDEVMPKTFTIRTRIQKLKEDLKTATAAQKQKIEQQIAKLDSADRSMYDWMHHYDPIPDSLGEEKAKQYLDDELAKIKQVQEKIESALKESEQ